MRDGDIAAQREVLAVLTERVVPVWVGRAKYGVEITWTPQYGQPLHPLLHALLRK